MKEYTYEVEHTIEKQREPIVVHVRQARYRASGNDADASSLAGMYIHSIKEDRLKLSI